jgi:hypothetical protein
MDQTKIYDDQPESSARESLFAITFQNQIYLIQIADNKANIIISINSIIISIIVSVTGIGALSKTFEVGELYIMLPVTVIIITSLISVVLAIQAAKPQITSAKNDQKGNKPEKTSLLFFANYSDKTLDGYLSEMNHMLESKTSMKENMIIDIFNQGKILSRKYRLLNTAYQIFMYGIIFSVLSFLVMLIF